MSGVPSVVPRLVAIARRDALVEISYHFRLLFFFTGAFVSAFLAYYVADLVAPGGLLAAYDGSYFDFVVVGIALTSYAGLGVAALNQQVSAEMNAGTLEVLLSGPNRLGTLLGGGFIVPLALTTIEVAALLGIGIGGFGVGLSAARVLAAVPVVLLTILNFAALGVASAAVVLLVKRGDPISGPIFQLTLLMSGAVFPIELFPAWLETLCRATPGYYGVRGAREALLTDGGFRGTVDEIVVLLGFAAVLLPLSMWTFSRAIATAKRLGVLGSY